MKKHILSSLFLVGSFILFNQVTAAATTELNNPISQPTESPGDIIYYNTDTQDILITDEVIIRTIEPNPNLIKRNPLLNILSLHNGVWDLIGFEYVKGDSSIWYSTGGDYKVEIDQTDFGPVFYQLKEKDPHFDDNVGKTYSISGSKYFSLEYRDISSYVDDDDIKGYAEFYMSKLSHRTSEYLMAFYD